MHISELDFELATTLDNKNLLSSLAEKIQEICGGSRVPIRFVMTGSDEKACSCELGLIDGLDTVRRSSFRSPFTFRRRLRENTDSFNAVFVIPTGIGCVIGGHAGDANPVARVLASACDVLITHPNVLNAADINEQPENCLYVEGSVISRLLMGTAGLQLVRNNRILAIIDMHDEPNFTDIAVNSVNAARISFGLDCPEVVAMDPRVQLSSVYAPSGRATGQIERLGDLFQVMDDYRGEYDAVALSTQVIVPKSYHTEYYERKGEMINPWGGAEAILTHSLSMLYNVPTAHAPMSESSDIANLELGVVDPRMAAEVISDGYFLCVLKGLQRSPRVIDLYDDPPVNDLLTAEKVSCLIIPDGCIGLPTLAALEQGISVIAVRENSNLMRNDLTLLPWKRGNFYRVENYWEAAGVMMMLKLGLDPASIRRPYHRAILEITNGGYNMKM